MGNTPVMSVQKKHVLLVDDEEKLLKSIAQRMKILGFTTHSATGGLAAIEIATRQPIDLAIVDLQMPDMNGLVTITKLKEIQPRLKTVLLTGHGSDKVRQATESLNTLYFEKDEMGDFWNFIKKLNASGQVVVFRPPTTSSDESNGSDGMTPGHRIEIHPAKEHDTILEPAANRVDGSAMNVNRMEILRPVIVGETPAMQALRKTIARVATLDCTVTLIGEPGTGKELAARAIHAGSLRSSYRFLAINCASFKNEQLAEQVLGYKRGNLYDAIRTRSGIFSSGQVGTLFIDQVEKMPESTQDQLLRTLVRTDRQATGGQKTAEFDIRILVATDNQLAKRTQENQFNKSLYNRLAVFELTVPPLRERKDDIPPLCRFFFDKYRQSLGKPVESISPNVVETLTHYEFPENVRELEYIIERAVIIADSNTITLKHLPVRFRKQPKSGRVVEAGSFSTLAELEKRHILEVLESTHGNKSKTAEILGISRAALWRKLKQFKNEPAAP
jgi:two-component system response regulator AtoC